MKRFLPLRSGGLLALLATVGHDEPQPAGDSGALTVSSIAARIRAQAETTKTFGMTAYTDTMPGTKASYSMIAENDRGGKQI